MLEFTKMLEERTYQPHETILSSSQHVDQLFIIRKGEVEAVLCDRRNQEYKPANLGKDDFFGEAELSLGGKSVANVRAGSGPVEVVLIPRAEFARVLNESPVTAEAVGKIMQTKLETQRIAEHPSGKA